MSQLYLLQLNSGARWADNKASILAQLSQQAPRKGGLILLPENFACMGHPGESLQLSEVLGDGPIQQQLSDWAREFQCYLVAGSLPTRSPDPLRCYTTSLAYGPDGAMLQYYHKLHLFDARIRDKQGQYRESEIYCPGHSTALFDTDFGRVGMSVCYDLRFPQLYQNLRQQGAEIILVPSAFTAVTGQAHWQPLLQARAIETQCYIMAANQGGSHPMGPGLSPRKSWGHSMLISPWGEILGQLGKEPGCLTTDFSRQKMDDVRDAMPVLAHARFDSQLR